jgi:hypothetical protein
MRFFLPLLTCLTASQACAVEKAVQVKEIVLQDEDYSQKIKDKKNCVKSSLPRCQCTSHVSYPQLSGGNPDVVKMINATLEAFAEKHVIKDFTTSHNCFGEDLSYTSVDVVSGIISIQFSESTTHITYDSHSYGLVFNTYTGKSLSFKDVVAQKHWKKASKECERQYAQESSDEISEDNHEWLDDAFSLKGMNLDQDFFINKKKRVILMTSNFLPHVMGSFDCEIPATLLQPDIARQLQ